jgi:hypothetical protein
MKQKIEKLLDAMVEMVDDTSMPYAEKVKILKAVCAEAEAYQMALEEFVSYAEEVLDAEQE